MEDVTTALVNTKLNENPALRALGLIGAAAVTEVSEGAQSAPPAAEKQSWRDWFLSFIPFAAATQDVVAGSDVQGQKAVNGAARRRLYDGIINSRSGRDDAASSVSHGEQGISTLGQSARAVKGLAEAATDFHGLAPSLAAASSGGLAPKNSSGNFAKPTVAQVAASKINITEKGLQHVLERHVAEGALSAGKSLFNTGENISNLIKAAESVAPVRQSFGKNFERIIDAGRAIGIDRVTGKLTSIYTVITNAAGDLITAFPGKP